MVNAHIHAVVRLVEDRFVEVLDDRALLERFAQRQDQEAFAALVRRHGPQVMAACRRVLIDRQDAEDAFQAAFLILARRAAAVRWHASVGSWLLLVCRRVALRAKARLERSRSRELPITDTPAATDPDPRWSELRLLLDEELARLPQKFRPAVVLCYLEGKTQAEAARQLAISEDAINGRLKRARTLLRDRLARRGVTLSVGILELLLAESASAAGIPAALVRGTAAAALDFIGEPAAAGAALSATSVALAKGVLQTMVRSKLQSWAVLAVVAAGFLGMGALGVHRLVRADEPPTQAPKEVPAPAAQPAAPKPLPAELDIVPRDVFYFVSARVADLNKNLIGAELLKKLQKQVGVVPPNLANQGLDDFEKKTGIDVAKIVRATLVVDDVSFINGKADVVGVITADKALDRKKVVEGLAPNANDPFKEEKVGEKTCYVAKELALYFLDERTFCVGEVKAVRKWARMGKDDRSRGPLQGALGLAAQEQLVMGLNPAPIALPLALAEGQLPEEIKPLLHLVKTSSTSLALTAGKELELDLFLTFGNAKSRDLAAKDIKAALPKLVDAVAPLAKALADQGQEKGGKLMEKLTAALKAAPLRQEGLRLHIPVYVKIDAAGLRAVLEESVGKAMPGKKEPVPPQPIDPEK
jgi:RNA polymerase sigma factor (sigma-70 family)